MRLDDPDRLDAIRRSGLVDAPVRDAFDRAARLAAALLGVPIAHTTVVLDDRQFFPSVIGFPEPLATDRESGLEYSFCKHIVTDERPFIVPNTREVPVLDDNPVVKHLGVAAYCGVPFYDEQGVLLGSICGLQFEPRDWTTEEVGHLEDLAAFLQDDLRLRAEVRAHREAGQRTMKIGLAADQIRDAAKKVGDVTRTMERRGMDVTEVSTHVEAAARAAQSILDALGD